MEEINLNCGVYQIRNIITGFCYGGQSIHLKQRPRQHWSLLKNNKHTNSHLQNSYNKHGRECFVFEVLIYCDKKYLTYYEQLFYNIDKSHGLSYNVRDCVDSNRGIKLSEEACKNMSISAKRKPPITEETRNKMSKSQTGRHHSKETIEKMSRSAMGHIISEETRKKIGEANKGENNYWFGKHHDDKTCQKLSNANIGRKKGDNPSSKHVGICLRKSTNRWSARININRKRVFLGYFSTEEKAIEAYENKLKEIGGFHNDSEL